MWLLIHAGITVYKIGSRPLVRRGKKHLWTSAFSGNTHWKVMGTGPYEAYGPVSFWMSFIHCYLNLNHVSKRGPWMLVDLYCFNSSIDGDLGSFSMVVATFNHVGRSFYLFKCHHGDIWIIPALRSYMLLLYCCMLSMFHISSQIVANISTASFSIAL